MLQQSNKLWSKILDSKYGGWRSLVEGRRGNNESAWWKDIMEVTQDQQLNPILQDGITWRVGCGDKIKFWEDSWAGHGEALQIKYPRLYRISLQQHQLIQQVGNFNESSWEWNLSWRRALFDNEIASIRLCFPRPGIRYMSLYSNVRDFFQKAQWVSIWMKQCRTCGN